MKELNSEKGIIKYHSFRGSERVKKAIDSFNNDIIVYFDPDVDGMVAGYLVCKYLESIGKSYYWYVNTNRQHGWSLNLNKVKGKDIIAVDFLIDSKQVYKILESGCNLVSMDHHVNGDKYISMMVGKKFGFVINNQYGFEEEDGRYLSGAGVVFETLRLISPVIDTVENRALVGLTLLSDVCNIENQLAKGYLYDLFTSKYKGYIKYLIDGVMGEKDYGFGVPRMDRNFVDFTFSPKINSCLRFNKEEMVVNFFLGKGGLDLEFHKKQKQLVLDLMSVMSVRRFSNLTVCFFKDWEFSSPYKSDVLSNFVGLVASRYLDGKRSVICYVISKKEDGTPFVLRASFRGNINGVDYLEASKNYIHGVGHPSAFGVLDLVPTKQTFELVNEACKNAECGYEHRTIITPIANMSIFANRNGHAYAEHNMYCLSQNRKYVRYVGRGATLKREGASYREYTVDGVSVMCFDLKLDFSNGLIFPILERGFIKYYLQSSG